MTRYGFVFNLDTCGDLRGCMLACKAKTKSFLGSHYTDTMTSTSGKFPNPNTYFVPTRCQHCAKPACVDACPKNVLYRRDDGIVAVGDTASCETCENKACMEACVYDSIYLDRKTGRVGKCDMCADLIDAGDTPACAKICCSHSIFFGDFDDPASAVSQLTEAWGENGYVHKLLPENDPAMHYLLSKHEWTGMEHLRSSAWHDDEDRNLPTEQ